MATATTRHGQRPMVTTTTTGTATTCIDAPKPMAFALVVLMVAPSLPGCTGPPHALGGSNRQSEKWLPNPASRRRMSLRPPITNRARWSRRQPPRLRPRLNITKREAEGSASTELGLMVCRRSWRRRHRPLPRFFFVAGPRRSESVAQSSPDSGSLLRHRVLRGRGLPRHAIVQPIKANGPKHALWKVFDAGATRRRGKERCWRIRRWAARRACCVCPADRLRASSHGAVVVWRGRRLSGTSRGDDGRRSSSLAESSRGRRAPPLAGHAWSVLSDTCLR